VTIWIVNHYAWPPSGPGGTRHHALARKLIQRGHRALVFAANFNHFTHEVRVVGPQKQHRICAEEGVPFCWLSVPAYSGNSVGRVWNMFCFVRRLTTVVRKADFEAPDVIIGSSVHPFAAWGAERCAKRLKVPFVFEVRDLWPQTLIDLGRLKSWHPFVFLLRRLEIYLYKRARQIVTLLPGAAEYIARSGGEAQKITWIPNGVDFDLVSEVRPPEEKTPFVVSYAGALGLANGVDSIIEVARRLKIEGWEKRILFHIYGTGQAREYLRIECCRSALGNIKFMEPIPKSAIYCELMKAHAFYLFIADSPLYRWGYSMNKLFDYLACARPLILATSASYNPVAQANAGLTFRPGDLAGIVEGLKKLAMLPADVRWSMGVNGRRFAQENHDLNKLAEKFEEVLVRSIESRGKCADDGPAVQSRRALRVGDVSRLAVRERSSSGAPIVGTTEPSDD
jgi:glycosyltransferase involved in cell wall biosynthesis